MLTNGQFLQLQFPIILFSPEFLWGRQPNIPFSFSGISLGISFDFHLKVCWGKLAMYNELRRLMPKSRIKPIKCNSQHSHQPVCWVAFGSTRDTIEKIIGYLYKITIFFSYNILNMTILQLMISARLVGIGDTTHGRG